ncbi:MAG: phosphotransferase [Woeseiaceae bacterium]|nr:phosphotransferase [Woeseiaceae bacterium]
MDILSSDDPFAVLKTDRPIFSPAAAARVLNELYGRDGDLDPLDSERDLNYRLTERDGRNSVLKFANSAEPAPITAYQTEALVHVARCAPELPVPRVIPATTGALVTDVAAEDGRSHSVRLFSWIDGVPIDTVTRKPDIVQQLGTIHARLGRALQGFDHAASAYSLLWDLKNATSLEKLLVDIDDVDLRRLCKHRLDRFRTAVLPKLSSVRWQTIHNDLNPGNVLVCSDSGAVAGIIDFGDLVRSPLVVDVAVACAYLVSDSTDPLVDVESFVAAYSSVTFLTESEIDILFDLILTRATMTILISRWRAARYPDNREYILSSEAEARQMLESLNSKDVAIVTERFRHANSAGKINGVI